MTKAGEAQRLKQHKQLHNKVSLLVLRCYFPKIKLNDVIEWNSKQILAVNDFVDVVIICMRTVFCSLPTHRIQTSLLMFAAAATYLITEPFIFIWIFPNVPAQTALHMTQNFPQSNPANEHDVHINLHIKISEVNTWCGQTRSGLRWIIRTRFRFFHTKQKRCCSQLSCQGETHGMTT